MLPAPTPILTLCCRRSWPVCSMAWITSLRHPIPQPVDPRSQIGKLATDWLTATRDFQESRFVPEYLGAPFQEAMCAVKQFEQDEFNRTITPFEYDAYLISA